MLGGVRRRSCLIEVLPGPLGPQRLLARVESFASARLIAAVRPLSALASAPQVIHFPIFALCSEVLLPGFAPHLRPPPNPYDSSAPHSDRRPAQREASRQEVFVPPARVELGLAPGRPELHLPLDWQA